MKTFADFDIDLGGRTGVEVATTCPQCSATRKKAKARCLSVNTLEGLWCCHHCGWCGSLKVGEEYRSRPPKRIVKPTYAKPSTVPPLVRDWFARRGISEEVISRHGIGLESVYMPQPEEEVPCMVIPSLRNGETVNLKYRTLEGKCFRQVKDAEKILFGLDDLAGHDVAVIVEGECDKLALDEAGIPYAVSVPDGAPPTGSKPSDTKFDYLQNCRSYLDPLTKIILAVDSDGPGQTLEAELLRRLGPERCWRVTWPNGCKDANDVLMQHGAGVLNQCITDAKPFPLEGVLSVEDAAEDVAQLYSEGLRGGVSTGWATLDQCYTVRPGELTILTGIPSHGKSQFLDALAVNLAKQEGWTIGLCSPENLPVARHIAKQVELYTGFPFREGRTQRLPREGLVSALDWLNRHMVFIAPDDCMSILAVLDRAKGLVSRYGIRGLVLDPWNEFDHTRPSGLTETEYISTALGMVRRFARRYGVHVWLVAHPQKLYRRDDGSYPVPTPYDISGSAHFRNKADNCLTVWRDEQEPGSPVKLYVQKIRFREVGKVGVVELHWNPVNGRYSDTMMKLTGTH
ncbi:MAG: DnaB-like helicase C-terminal domain-containing protein [Nitrospira sp.]